MKKSIFLSVLALAAVVSCQKSEVVDTKYNEEIGFETYVGRDAMTKATPYGSTALPNSIGVYGFYLGTATDWTTDSKANLWVNESFAKPSSGDWTTTNKKYWTNGTDKYTFFAYAPYADGTLTKGDGSLVAPTTVNLTNPALVYTVPTALANQVDLIYSNNLNTTFKNNTDATKLTFQHALARLTVKALAKENTAGYTFHVKEVSINGKFITNDVLTLSSGRWTKDGAVAETATTYTFYTNNAEASDDNKLSATAVDYAGTNNYLMMIPTDFSSGATTVEGVTTYPNKATLTVKYTTKYAGQESTINTKTIDIPTNFLQGKAYAINLEFELNTANEISFSVFVADWVDGLTIPTEIIKG